MRFIMILAVGVCLLFAAVPAVAQSAADEAAVRDAMKQIHDTYNAKDLKAFMALIDESTENWTGTIKGRVELEKEIAGQFKQSKDGQLKVVEEIGVVFVTPDVAIHKFRDEYSGFLDEAGKPAPPGKRLMALLFVKRGDKWLSAARLFRPIEE